LFRTTTPAAGPSYQFEVGISQDSGSKSAARTSFSNAFTAASPSRS